MSGVIRRDVSYVWSENKDSNLILYRRISTKSRVTKHCPGCGYRDGLPDFYASIQWEKYQLHHPDSGPSWLYVHHRETPDIFCTHCCFGSRSWNVYQPMKAFAKAAEAISGPCCYLNQKLYLTPSRPWYYYSPVTYLLRHVTPYVQARVICPPYPPVHQYFRTTHIAADTSIFTLAGCVLWIQFASTNG